MKKSRRASELLRRLMSAWGGARPLSTGNGHADDEVRVYLLLPRDARMHVGTLTQEGDEFVFKYSPEFKGQDVVPPIPAFPDVGHEYHSNTLWPFFSVRVPPANREDVQRVISRQGIAADDDLRMLGVLGRRTATTPYELEFRDKAQAHWSTPPAEAF